MKHFKAFVYVLIILHLFMYGSFLIGFLIWGFLTQIKAPMIFYFIFQMLVPQILCYIFCGLKINQLFNKYGCFYLLVSILFTIVFFEMIQKQWGGHLIKYLIYVIYIQSLSLSIMFFSWISVVSCFIKHYKRGRD